MERKSSALKWLAGVALAAVSVVTAASAQSAVTAGPSWNTPPRSAASVNGPSLN